ncbi:hydroxymethylglutaryl-CoA lyase [Ottowia thiooxydans]|uniref:Hydroxymethylglutaryl-CoA lyase n=1 Tax=Ottowia thiooxydans TaxID=219182 RepID=A0ABV2QBY4_9BURK
MSTDPNIRITEVALRDGLQGHASFIPTEQKLNLLKLLSKAGLNSIEATSFVSPKTIPQLADAEELIARSRELPDVRLSALAPNVRGVERAIASGVHEVAVVLAATDTMNRKNLGMSLDQAIAASEEVIARAASRKLSTRAYIAVAFECPFEGLVPSDVVVSLAARMLDAGATELVIADTIGAASPAQVQEVCRILTRSIPSDLIGLHLHDTRGMGVANAWAGISAGIRRFDASAGGLGGCPFAPGAAGNLATEDLVLMAESCGYPTGVDLPALYDAVAFASQITGRTLGGRSMSWAKARRTASVAESS